MQQCFISGKLKMCAMQRIGHSGLVCRFYYLQNIFVVDGERNLEYFLTKVFRALPVDSIAHSPPHSVLNYRENILQIMSYIDRGTRSSNLSSTLAFHVFSTWTVLLSVILAPASCLPCSIPGGMLTSLLTASPLVAMLYRLSITLWLTSL